MSSSSASAAAALPAGADAPAVSRPLFLEIYVRTLGCDCVLDQNIHPRRFAACFLSPCRFGCSASHDAMWLYHRATCEYFCALGDLTVSKTATSAWEGAWLLEVCALESMRQESDHNVANCTLPWGSESLEEI